MYCCKHELDARPHAHARARAHTHSKYITQAKELKMPWICTKAIQAQALTLHTVHASCSEHNRVVVWWQIEGLFNYRHFQILQSKCLKSNRRLPQRYSYLPPPLHSILLLEPIHKFIFRLTEKFFSQLFHIPQPACLPNRKLYFIRSPHTQYRKYIHKRTKHLLL